MSHNLANQLAFFLAAVFFAVLVFAVLVFLGAAFFVEVFLAALLDADFLAGFSSASSSSSGTSSPRPFLAAATDRWRAASRSTTSPADLVEVSVRVTSPPST